MRVTRKADASTTVMPGNTVVEMRCDDVLQQHQPGAVLVGRQQPGEQRRTLTRAKCSAPVSSATTTARFNDSPEMYGNGCAGSTASGVRTGWICSVNTSSNRRRSLLLRSDQRTTARPSLANAGSATTMPSAVAGSRATFTFTGTSVTWIGTRGPNRGIARVYLDGVLAAELDTYATPKQLLVPLYSAQGLSSGSHTLAVEATGLKNAASAGSFVFVDAFDVTLLSPAPQVRRFQQTDATYSGAWQTSTTNLLYTGGTMAYATAANASADFTFTGTTVRWIGERLFDGGIARVYVDGIAVADVDTWAPIQEEFQAAMFSASGLAPGSHTIRIQLTGGKNASSTGTRVVVDAFDVK